MSRSSLLRPGRCLMLLVGLSLASCGKGDPPAGGGGASPSATGAPGDEPRVAMIPHPSGVAPPAPSAAPSVSESAPVEPKTALVGTWKFSGFDVSDPGTKSFWTSMPGVAQGELLTEASKATLIITPAELVTKVGGDQLRVPYTVEAAAPGAPGDQLVLKTKDGRKGVRFTDAKRNVVRVVELDSPTAPVAFFARMPVGAAPVAAASASAGTPPAAALSASAAKK